MKKLELENKLIIRPILPLKNVVLLPKAVIPVRVSRNISTSAVNQAFLHHFGEIFVTTQKNLEQEDIVIDDLRTIGVVGKILESVVEKDGSLKILVEGLYRASMVEGQAVSVDESKFFLANLAPFLVQEEDLSISNSAYLRTLKSAFKDYASANSEKVAAHLLKSAKEFTKLEPLIDFISVNAELTEDLKRVILEEISLAARAEKLYRHLQNEIEIIKAEKKIRRRVQSQVEKHQKDYYLNEQVRAIYKELGKDDALAEVEKLKEQGRKLKMSIEAYEKLLIECKKLEQMQPSSPEATVSRSYIEWLLAVPWNKKSKDTIGLEAATKILNSSHSGMKKAKDLILDFIAAKKFAKENLKTNPVVCLVGPPGVGKTTLAESMAKSLGRAFVRISLGGLRDEAEIRGHRRTYIGSMPGKIISAMRKAGVINPVILLDEIDKMSSDFRGDPSAALLEVLDPEQNKTFSDHFLETGYDLSQVVFIATANLFENIPYPLLDRMEIINLSGYTEAEKIDIAQKFLLPKLKDEHALKNGQVVISEDILKKIISEYTREAGVRHLNRLILKIIRKCIVHLLSAKKKSVIVSEELVETWLGYPKFKHQDLSKKDSVGVATGLAWTEVGGDVLEVEIVKLKGKGNLTITGQLGEVMQESAQAALSCIRSICKQLGLKDGFSSSFDLHLHLPEGSTPKDGPSAGITMAVALTSIFTDIPVDRSLAMSGEITLQGRVLAVGGLKEKLLAASRYGLKKVIVPKENKLEIEEIQKDLKFDLEIVFVEHLSEVLQIALVRNPFTKISEETSSDKVVAKRKKTNVKKEKGIAPSVRAKRSFLK